MENTDERGRLCRRRSRQRGLTLLEAIATLGIVAVVIVAAAPRASGVLAALEVRAGAVRVASAMIRGRIGALREGRTWVLAAGARELALGPLGEEPVREKLPGRARVRSATSGGEVRFAPSGLAENATFTLGVDGREERVVLNQRGRVTLAD
jgi:type II secretory pathway pseudopilin PulG